MPIIVGKGVPYRIGEEVHYLSKEAHEELERVWKEYRELKKDVLLQGSILTQLKRIEEGVNRLPTVLGARGGITARHYAESLRQEIAHLKAFMDRVRREGRFIERDERAVERVLVIMEKHLVILEKSF